MDYHSVTEFCTPLKLINDGTQVQVLRVFLTIDTDRRNLERIATVLHAPSRFICNAKCITEWLRYQRAHRYTTETKQEKRSI